MKNTKLLATVFAVTAGLLSLTARPALAADSICTISSLAYANNGEVALYCSQGSFYAWSYNRGTGCNVRSADALKSFLSLAQAALLSGKSLRIYYNSCAGGLLEIDSVHLIK